MMTRLTFFFPTWTNSWKEWRCCWLFEVNNQIGLHRSTSFSLMLVRRKRSAELWRVHWFSQLLAPQRSTAFSESGGHSVSQIRLGRNNKCRGYERGTHFLKTE